MKTHSARLPLVVGCATVAAMLPYLAIKTAWLAGSDVGLTDPGLMRETPFVVGNLITAGMEVAGAALAVTLVHRWGRRIPAWLVLFPMWVASGLLAPAMVAAPLAYLAESLTGAAAAGGTDTGAAPDGLQGWVYGVVYGGFILQGTGLAVAFALHVRARWGALLGSSVGSRRPGATHHVQVMATVAVGGLTALVMAVRLYWAAGGEAGLPAALGASPTQQVVHASSATLALAGLLGLAVLVSRRARGLRLWGPLAAAWVGAGSMFCSAAYQLVILLAPESPFEASGGGGFGLLLVTQMIGGTVAAVTVAFHLAEAAPVAYPEHRGHRRPQPALSAVG
ncbi:hypothetical protein GCM10011608_02350 [Micromonospora sonchi]|uniref:Uncharacterized protein n=1 Tax=Micromonospora sonchi TaxID=1763543 RepID=A0A917WQD0_9ACTN|nr:hypothetical protein [Micromonospora sonchi]GGM21208.1 hypothetical protein GCM10011608_02350 [Micromonospora sonchi]